MASVNYGLRVTNTIKRTVNTGSHQTAATNASTEYIRVVSDTDGVFVAFGANPTATTNITKIGTHSIMLPPYL